MHCPFTSSVPYRTSMSLLSSERSPSAIPDLYNGLAGRFRTRITFSDSDQTCKKII